MTYLAPGTVFANDYRVIRHLSSGGMGSVFIVEQMSTGKERALKVMHRELAEDSGHRLRFETEARISASIESDHVVEVLAAGVDAELGIPWLVMELLRGETLDEHVSRVGALSIPAVRECARQLRHVLEQAHMIGLVHRDLKPENLFLATPKREDVPFTLKVLDFGIAKWAQEATSTLKNSQMIGSPLWMAPEQLHTGADLAPATDVWALGLIFYHLLTGKHYWATANAPSPSITGLLLEVVGNPMPLASERARQYAPGAVLPEGFDGWFARATDRALTGRFPHAGACLGALVELLADRTSVPPALAPAAPRGDVASFDTLAVAGSNDAEMLLRIARVYELRDTDRPRAVQAYRRVLELAPSSQEAFDALAGLLGAMGKSDELIDALSLRAQAVEGAAAAPLHARRAELLEARGDRAGAHAAYTAAFTADPRDPVVTAALVERTADPAGLAAILAAAAAAGQDSAALDALAGDVAAARGDLPAADAAYARALSNTAREDARLRAKFAAIGASSGVLTAEEVRARWANVIAVELRHAAAWEGVVQAAEKLGDADDYALTLDAAIAVLGADAPTALQERAASHVRPKGPGITVGAPELVALAETPLDGGAPLLAAAPPKRPLKEFGLGIKELVDPSTSSRALLQRTMPIYRQLSTAAASFDLPVGAALYFREGDGVGFERLWSEPEALLAHAGVERWSADELVFAAHLFQADSRPELAGHAAWLATGTAPDDDTRAYLEGCERAAARAALLATRSLLAAGTPLAARRHAVLSAADLFADLARFVARGAAAATLRLVRDAA